MSATLSYDLLLRILDHFRDDHTTLYSYSLVNWEFNRAASKILYSRAVLSPPFQRVLDLRNTGIPPSSNFPSASLPRNAPHVLELEISGFISARPSSRNALGSTLVNAIQTFKNLRTIKFTPQTYHDDLLTESLNALHQLSSLQELSVNTSCMDETKSHLLCEISGLKHLTLYNPSRAVLQVLPDWLAKLSHTLSELHLKDNCGSVTPGVLKSFLPHVQDRLRSFSLGLSYSLTNHDVFTFIGQLQELEHVRLRYYWQLKPPPQQPSLTHLRHFTVDHSRVQTRYEVRSFCKWVRTAIATSAIEALSLVSDEDGEYLGANLSFGSLIDHMTKKHASTVRFLDFRSAFVGIDALEMLFRCCTSLEEFYISAGPTALIIFREHLPGLRYLHSASFQLCNVKRNKFRLSHEEATSMIQGGSPTFRRLAINGTKWEGNWKSTDEGEVIFVVEEIHKKKTLV